MRVARKSLSLPSIDGCAPICWKARNSREKFGMRGEIVEQVGVLAAPGEDADAAREALGVVAGVLQRFPRRLEQQAMLRVGVLGLARIDAEEVGVEQVDVRP